MNIVLVGGGRFGTLHLQILTSLSDVHVKAIVEPETNRRKELQEQFHIPSGYDSLEDCFNAETDLDAVDIVSTEETHGSFVLQALDRRLDVFVEKPLAASLEEVRKIAAHPHRHRIMTGHVSRFVPEHVQMRQALEQGSLGKLNQIRALRDFPASWFKAFGHRIHPVFESGIHDLDLITAYAGTDWTEIRAAEQHHFGLANPDSFQAWITFKSGVHVSLESSWLLPDATPQTLGEFGPLKLEGTIREQFELLGTEASAVLRIPSGQMQIWGRERVQEPDLRLWPQGIFGVDGALKKEIEYFCTCVNTQEPFSLMPIEETIASFTMAEAIKKAGASGEVVKRNEVEVS